MARHPAVIRTLALGATAMAAGTLAGCASGYVLHPKEPRFLNKLVPGIFPAYETAPVAAAGKVAVLADRAERVTYEDTQEDGSVWLHYTLNMKNAGPSAVDVDLKGVHLLAEDIEIEMLESEIEETKIEIKKKGGEAEAEKSSATPGKKVTVKETRKFFARYRDGGKARTSLAPNAYLKLPVSFRIAKGAASKYGGSGQPIELVVPMKGLPKGIDDIRLKLWLWRVK